MNEGHDEQQDTRFSVNSKLNLDPAQAGKKLKQQQQKIDDPQNKNNRNAAEDHSKTSYPLFMLLFRTDCLINRPLAAMHVAVSLGHNFHRLINC